MFRCQFASRQFFARLTTNPLAAQKQRLTFSVTYRINERFHESELTPLHKAARDGQLERVKELINAGADVNSKLTNGLTPLQTSLPNGHVECMKLLIESGADVNCKQNFHEVTTLHSASFYGHTNV